MEVMWMASAGEEDDTEAVKEASLAVGNGGVLMVVGELAEELSSRNRTSSDHAPGKDASAHHPTKHPR